MIAKTTIFFFSAQQNLGRKSVVFVSFFVLSSFSFFFRRFFIFGRLVLFFTDFYFYFFIMFCHQFSKNLGFGKFGFKYIIFGLWFILAYVLNHQLLCLVIWFFSCVSFYVYLHHTSVQSKLWFLEKFVENTSFLDFDSHLVFC